MKTVYYAIQHNAKPKSNIIYVRTKVKAKPKIIRSNNLLSLVCAYIGTAVGLLIADDVIKLR